MTLEVAPELTKQHLNKIRDAAKKGITNATKVKITIGGNENYLLIVIADNGRGCDDVKQGFGLKHMRERLALYDKNSVKVDDRNFKELNRTERNIASLVGCGLPVKSTRDAYNRHLCGQ